MQTNLSFGGELRPPILSDFLSARDVAIYVDHTSLTRGRSYQRQGRVHALVVSADLKSITATVEGSRDEDYRQTIALSHLANSRIHINGNCTCPMAHNCKHVAAVLFEALSRLPVSQPSNLLAAVPAPVVPLPFDIKNWLEEFAQSAAGDAYPPEIIQRVLYFLSPRGMANATPQLAVEVFAGRLLKSGEFSNSLIRPGLSNFQSSYAPRYFRPSDIGICQALVHNRSGFGSNSFPITSFDLLKRMVETGRTYWVNQNSEPLKLGDIRAGRIQWIMPDGKGMRPVLDVEGALAWNAEPPVYIDVKNSLIGEIGVPLPPHLAYRLLNAPAIAPSHVAQVSQALGLHLPAGSELIPTPPAAAIMVEDEPVAVLRLMRGSNPINPYYHGVPDEFAVARLTFNYGPIPVTLGETNPVVETISGNRRYQAKRRPAFERHSVDRLFSLDLRFAREIYSLTLPDHHQDFAFSDSFDWLDFLAHDAAALEADGFQIRVDDDFPYRVTKPTGELETEIFEGTGVDWFELGMGVQVDGQKLDLAPLLANLVLTDGLDPAAITSMAEESADIYIPLDDGRHLALAAKRFLPVIIALHELTVGGSVIGKSGRLRVSKAETALLSDLEEHEGIVFKGAENLRKLARTLNLSAAGIAPVTLPATFKATLRPYQSEGVAWLNLLRDVGLGGVLADDMGLGKTVQILALLALEKAEGRLTTPALIIAPTSLMTNWQNEASKFAPDLRLLLLHGAARHQRFEEIACHDVVLTTYPLIARDQATLMEQQWHMAILDEAQTIKNPNAATTKLIRELKSTHRFCLTGTPMENHLGELWSLMSFVNPGYLGDKTGFSRRWRTPIEKYSDTDRSQILARRVKPFMLRRTKQEVASELPLKTEITESIVFGEVQRDVYDSIRLAMHQKVRQAIAAKGFAKSHIVILEALLKLRQVCCDPRLLKLRAKNSPSAKLERLMEMLESLLPEGRKIIIFSQFTSMLSLIAERLQASGITFSLLTGETKDRKTAIDTFQDGTTAIFLVSLKAGGVGLNLTAADTVILYDPWWNPAVEEQAIDRAYRIGQDKPVFVYRLVVGQTIEEKMDELKSKKRALAASIFDQGSDAGAALTEADLSDLFGL